MDIKNFGKNCKAIREQHELSQKMLADFADISPNEVCQYERGKRFPTLINALKIAKVLRVKVDDLLAD